MYTHTVTVTSRVFERSRQNTLMDAMEVLSGLATFATVGLFLTGM
jgi:hypothetical protein